MLIDELIEKAFSDGYEYALMEQREFNNAPQKELRKKNLAKFLIGMLELKYTT